MKKRLLVGAGALFTILGLVGIFIPVWPTTPFLLLAVACFGRSSPRAYRWLLNNRYFGVYLRDYREGRGIPLVAKVVAIAFLWVMIGCSALIFVSLPVVKVVLVLIALAVTVHLVTLPNAPRQRGHIPRSAEQMTADDRQR